MDVAAGIALYGVSKYVGPELAKCAGGFLSRCFTPIGEAIGQDLATVYKDFRSRNLANAVVAAQKILEECNQGDARVVLPEEFAFRAMDEAAKSSDDRIQRMWGGLIAAVAKESSPDSSELLWVNLLSRMTPIQAALLEWSAQKTKVVKGEDGIKTDCWTLKVDQVSGRFPDVAPLLIEAEILELKAAGLFHGAIFPGGENLKKGICGAASVRGLLLYSKTQGNPSMELVPNSVPDSGIGQCSALVTQITADHSPRWL